MEKAINQYLDTVFDYLKGLSISEKTDIINEIKSHIKERQLDESIEIEKILSDLGNPKELARSYVGDKILEKEHIGVIQLCKLIGYYSVTGLTSIIVIPTLGISSLAFYVAAIGSVIAAIINIPLWLFRVNTPGFSLINLGFWQPNGIIASIMTVGIAYLLYLFSKWLFKILKLYIISIKKQPLV